ncbi:unnamed protein product [Ambrosiozyma monospora]|uniref:Unnamed protein product n=1 Tax=Ambrosiozyma monospora TaxID=43982 RepID=A0ACB5TDM7_AMBMO|nr:unnamed protein product [Ambrosiozyma monospora]
MKFTLISLFQLATTVLATSSSEFSAFEYKSPVSTAPWCSLDCAVSIAKTCPDQLTDLSCLCEKKTEFLDCLTDVCPDDNYYAARDHYLGTCLEHIPELRNDSDYTFWLPGNKKRSQDDSEGGCPGGNDCSGNNNDCSNGGENNDSSNGGENNDCSNGSDNNDYFIPDPDFESDGLALSYASAEQRDKTYACDEKIDMLKRQIKSLVKFRKVKTESSDQCE